MIDKNDVMESMYKFIGRAKLDESGKVVRDENGEVVYDGGNPVWRKVYREAPPMAKRRLVLSWYYSMNKQKVMGDGGLNDEFTNLKEAMDKTLGKADLEYLIANLGKYKDAVEHYKQLLAALPEEGAEGQTADGQPQEGQTAEGEEQQTAQGDETAQQTQTEEEQNA